MTALIDEWTDPMASVRAWTLRMSVMYGPKVWDQEQRLWLTWEQALTKLCFGDQKTWLLDIAVWDESAAKRAAEWEDGTYWPAWAVKAHLVDVRPCDFEDHKWSLAVDQHGTRLICKDPCDDPRIFCDADGRYVFPACQNLPDTAELKCEIDVEPEWVYLSEEDWWVELNTLK